MIGKVIGLGAAVGTGWVLGVLSTTREWGLAPLLGELFVDENRLAPAPAPGSAGVGSVPPSADTMTKPDVRPGDRL